MTKTKIFTILTIMIIIFLVGCKKEEDTPPPFGAPPVERMMRGFTGTVPEGFGVPVDVFNNKAPIIKEIPPLTADPTDQNIPTVTASVSQPGGWVWKEGYRYDWSTKTWVKYVFPQDAYGTTNWIKASASTSLSDILYNSVALDVKEDPEGGNLILAFTCKRYSGEWKCGCTTTTETAPCAKWMARKYAVNTELPPVKDPGVPPNLYEAPAVTVTPIPAPTVDLATKAVGFLTDCPAGKVVCGLTTGGEALPSGLVCCTTQNFVVNSPSIETVDKAIANEDLFCTGNRVACGAITGPFRGNYNTLDMIKCCETTGITKGTSRLISTLTGPTDFTYMCNADEVVCGLRNHQSAIEFIDDFHCCKIT